jgi:hypothetical protein
VGDRAVLDGPTCLSDLHSVWHHVEPDHGLVAVEFEFGEGVLLVEVDPGFDEVELPFGIGLTAPVPRHWPDATRESVTGTTAYRELRGLDSTWRWVLWNQRGYSDAFQIELGPAGATTTLQYLAIASKLERRVVVTTR